MIWLEKYKDKLGIRYDTFKFLFNYAYDHNLKEILETGTARGKQRLFFSKPNWKDGMSSLLFAEYIKLVNGHLWTCDIDKANIKNAQKFLKKFENIQFVVDDSVNFIKNFHKKVDIIYLDSLDGNLPGASEHQLSETLYAIKKINSGGIIMLDDKGQKTNLSIDYLIKNGFEILFENNVQVILKNS